MNAALTIQLSYPEIGRLIPATASSPNRGCWTLGCETLDRDFADFDAYKDYIPQLAVGSLRFQSGWAKTEKVAGQYDFSWLDAQVDAAISMGMNPLLETGYGNPIYPGGAGIDIGGGLPKGEGLEAYQRWVKELVQHFAGRVRDFAAWNEPDTARQKHTDEEIVALNIQTAKNIRSVLPDARIGALSIADFSNTRRFESYIRLFAEQDALGLFDWYIFHGYKMNPDQIGETYRTLKSILEKYGARGILRQGEAGCPSEPTTRFAMRGVPWSELSQSKWDLRHYITDHAFGVPSSIFTACDFLHRQTIANGPGGEINRKGLLMADSEHRVIRPKLAFHAMRHMTTLFNESTIPTEGVASILAPRTPVAWSWRRKGASAPIVAYWDRTGIPGDATRPESAAVVAVRGAGFACPVLVEPVSGHVHAIPAEVVHRDGDLQWFRDLPYIDSPLVIADRDDIPLEEKP